MYIRAHGLNHCNESATNETMSRVPLSPPTWTPSRCNNGLPPLGCQFKKQKQKKMFVIYIYIYA